MARLQKWLRGPREREAGGGPGAAARLGREPDGPEPEPKRDARAQAPGRERPRPRPRHALVEAPVEEVVERRRPRGGEQARSREHRERRRRGRPGRDRGGERDADHERVDPQLEERDDVSPRAAQGRGRNLRRGRAHLALTAYGTSSSGSSVRFPIRSVATMIRTNSPPATPELITPAPPRSI